jgi:hypothetical protein
MTAEKGVIEKAVIHLDVEFLVNHVSVFAGV